MHRNALGLVLAALFAALLAAGSVFSLPLPPPLPPVTLAVFVALFAGLALGPVRAGAAVALFLGIGALGLPVFANASGGLGHFAGPTGGFLLGYLPAALLCGALADRRAWSYGRNLAAALAGVVALYALGLPWFRAVLDARPDRELSMAGAFMIMLPYLIGDVVKAAAAAALARALKPLLTAYFPPRSRA